MSRTFDESKEETYPFFQKRCGELLQDFLREKGKEVCSLCSESCSEPEKTHKALQALIEFTVREAANRCEDKVDIFMCVLCPYLATSELFQRFAKGEYAKRLAKELERGRKKFVAILRSRDGPQNTH